MLEAIKTTSELTQVISNLSGQEFVNTEFLPYAAIVKPQEGGIPLIGLAQVSKLQQYETQPFDNGTVLRIPFQVLPDRVSDTNPLMMFLNEISHLNNIQLPDAPKALLIAMQWGHLKKHSQACEQVEHVFLRQSLSIDVLNKTSAPRFETYPGGHGRLKKFHIGLRFPGLDTLEAVSDSLSQKQISLTSISLNS